MSRVSKLLLDLLWKLHPLKKNPGASSLLCKKQVWEQVLLMTYVASLYSFFCMYVDNETDDNVIYFEFSFEPLP